MRLQDMTKIILFCLLIAYAITAGGCLQGTETIKVEYLPGFKAQRLFTDYQPSIAVNSFWDERPITDRVGEGYNMYGGKIETWVTDRLPTEILEEAIIAQLRELGFEVIKTSGWNLNADSIPEYLNTDFLLGGRLKAFWVESRPGMFTVSINSRVTFDLIIVDVKTKRILWAGQFTGADKPETIIRTNEEMRMSLSRSLTQAVNKAFQDEQVKTVFLKIAKMRF